MGTAYPCGYHRPMTAALASWSRRRWLAALAAAVATIVVMGVPTALIPTPVFGREVPVTLWAWPVLLATSVLSGLLLATYVRQPDQSGRTDAGATDDAPRASRSGTIGGLLSFLAVGCPVCNKLALVALGYSGALQWFAPVQPVLAAVGVGLLAWALRQRLRGQIACPLPA